MDRDEDGFLNFREFVYAIGMTSSADMTLRLKLLFALHLPPLLSPTEIESPQQGNTYITDWDLKLKRPGLKKKHITDSDAEVAAEATDFFDSFEQQASSLGYYLLADSANSPDQGIQSNH